MPSPLIHCTVGLLGGRCVPRDVPRKTRWVLVVGCVVLAMAPDLDVLAGLMADGPLSGVHNQWTHSVLWCMVLSVAVAGVAKQWLRNIGFWRIFAVALALTGSHLVMDWLTWGRGVRLFWPFSEHRFGALFPLFYGVRYSEGLCSSSHWITFASEIGTLLLVAWVAVAGRAWVTRRAKKRKPEAASF